MVISYRQYFFYLQTVKALFLYLSTLRKAFFTLTYLPSLSIFINVPLIRGYLSLPAYLITELFCLNLDTYCLFDGNIRKLRE